MAKKISTLEDWEVSLIKAMLADGNFQNKQEILPYFSRPGRTINQARISQIASGTLRPDVEKATIAQLRAFLGTWSDQLLAKKSFVEEEPLHPTAITQTFRLKKTTPPRLDLGETDWVEAKQNFNWSGRAGYARTMAGFANNRGGYLLFGVQDANKTLVGLQGRAFDDRDPATITQYLNQCFSPAIRWEKGNVTLGDIELGIIYVWPCLSKPLVCTKDDGSDLREADIYFRYPGETRRIKSAELQYLLNERERLRDDRWRQTVSKIGEMGVNNAAVLNTVSGGS